MANGDINVRIAAAGDMTQGRNEINPRFQANALRNARGLDCGVLANDFYNESADYLGITRGANSGGEPFAVANNYSASQITIGAGMATAYGYDLQIEQNIALTTDENGSALTAATGYLFVYLEWDLTGSPAVGDIKIHNNGTAGVWRSIYTDNDNLIENPQGKYKLPLHRFYKASTGSIRYDGSWETLNLARTIERPQVATTAVYAETMPEGTSSDRVATTLYVDRQNDENLNALQDALTKQMDEINDTILNFSETTFTVAGVANAGILRRLAGVVIFDFDTSVWLDTTARDNDDAWYNNMGTIPEGYRPQSTVVVSCNCWQGDFANTRWIAGRLTINTDGTMTMVAERENTMANGDTGQLSLHVGYKCEDTPVASVITAFDKHPVNLSYDATKAYVSAPSYFESGKSFEIRAEALTPAQEASVSVSGGSVSGGERGNGAKGNGAFTITPTSSATSMTITVTTANIDVGGSTGSTTEA